MIGPDQVGFGRVRVYRDRLLRRLSGTLFGVGFFAIGAFALTGGDGGIDSDRATAFGFTAMIIGVIAVVASWTVPDPNDVWCAQPRRWWRRLGDRSTRE